MQVDNRFNRKTLYNTLKTDCLFDRWEKHALLLIYKLLTNLLPQCLCSLIQRRESSYNIRNYDTVISLPKPIKTNYFDKK